MSNRPSGKAWHQRRWATGVYDISNKPAPLLIGAIVAFNKA
jgi:hypothetical protein